VMPAHPFESMTRHSPHPRTKSLSPYAGLRKFKPVLISWGGF
jgi:hypothetical protein